MQAERRADRLRTVADHLKERIARKPDDAQCRRLRAELDELEGKKTAVASVAEGVAVLADDLEEAA